MRAVRTAYGPHPDQFPELTLPAGAGPAPVVVVLHGGSWRAAYGVEPARPLAANVAVAGFAAVAVVGHSAGGHLAAWAAGRDRLPEGAPGVRPRGRVAAAVLQAGVLDLERAAAQGLGGRAVQDLLGAEPAAVPERCAVADPVRLVPAGADLLCLHGTGDATVPAEQSTRYAQAAAAQGVAVDVRLVPGDHMVLIDPAGEPWELVRDWLRSRTGVPRGRSTLGL